MDQYHSSSPQEQGRTKIAALRDRCIQDDSFALRLMEDPLDALERSGLDFILEDGAESPRMLSSALQNLSVKHRRDILHPLLRAMDSPATVLADDDGNGEILLVVNVAVAVNAGGFVNVALVVNVEVFANAYAGVNYWGYDSAPDSSGMAIRLSEDFVASELASHLTSVNLSGARQSALMARVVEQYREAFCTGEPMHHSIPYTYRGQRFVVDIASSGAGSVEIRGGQLLN